MKNPTLTDAAHTGERGMAGMSNRDIYVAAYVSEFWTHVDRSDPGGCWPWTGYSEKGYGRAYFDGRMRFTHELALTFATGEVRHPDLETCHGCGNAICNNPAHLRFDTSASNAADTDRHGTRVVTRKLSDENVVVIRQRAASGALGKDLAEHYGVSQSLVTEIIKGRRRTAAGGPIRTNHGNTKAATYV